MKLRDKAWRLFREESGFSLAEVLVTMIMMITVMFALYSVFDMSLRVFSFGNDKTEAVENARLGLERMEREIRAAYPYDKSNSQNHLFWSPGSPTTGTIPPSNSITFGNDVVTVNRKVDVPSEEITYSLSGTELQRNGQPVVGSVVSGGLQFEYLQGDGTTPASSESEIRLVQITLTTEVDRGLGSPATQALTTDVALRNRTG